MVVPLLLPYSQKEMPCVGAPVLRDPLIDRCVLEVVGEAGIRDDIEIHFQDVVRLAAPGTGAGGAAVVEIATVLFGSLKVLNPIATPFGS